MARRPYIRGDKAFISALQRIQRRTKTVMGQALFVGAQNIATEAKRLITEGSISGKNHVPSKPGQPPNADTRLLDKSIIPEFVSETHFRVRATAPYSAALEFGAKYKSGRVMAARPFMRVAWKNKIKDVQELVDRAFQKLIRDAE